MKINNNQLKTEVKKNTMQTADWLAKQLNRIMLVMAVVIIVTAFASHIIKAKAHEKALVMLDEQNKELLAFGFDDLIAQEQQVIFTNE